MTSAIGLSARTLGALIALAVGVRWAAILVLGTWQGGPEAAGAYEHDFIARQLVAGDGFSYPFYADAAEATATQAPLLPLLLAGAYTVFGVGSPAAILATQGANVALAVIAMCGLTWLTRCLVRGREPRAARAFTVCALLGFALAPPFVYMVTRIQSINASVCGLLLVLGLYARFIERPSRGRGGVAGVAVGFACLAEPILALPLGLAWWPLAIITRPPTGDAARRSFDARALLIPVLAASCVLPWVVRNTFMLGEPTFIKSSFWYVFWQGNHAHASGTDKLPVEPATAKRLRWRMGGAELESTMEAARRQAVSVDSMLDVSERRGLRALPDESARMAWFGDRIRGELAAEPMHYPRMVARRLAMIVWFDPTNPRSFAVPYRLPYLLLAVLAGAGLWGWGRPRGPDWIVVFAAIGLVAALAGIITSARFRLMIEALMILPAAWAAARVATWRSDEPVVPPI